MPHACPQCQCLLECGLYTLMVAWSGLTQPLWGLDSLHIIAHRHHRWDCTCNMFSPHVHHPVPMHNLKTAAILKCIVCRYTSTSLRLCGTHTKQMTKQAVKARLWNTSMCLEVHFNAANNGHDRCALNKCWFYWVTIEAVRKRWKSSETFLPLNRQIWQQNKAGRIAEMWWSGLTWSSILEIFGG